MNTDIRTPAHRDPLTAHHLANEGPSCPSCGLPGEVWATRDGQQVLLESNDPVVPLRAADVPPHQGWIIADHHAHPLTDEAAPDLICQVIHAAVCPRIPVPDVPPPLRDRRILNAERLQCLMEGGEAEDLPNC